MTPPIPKVISLHPSGYLGGVHLPHLTVQRGDPFRIGGRLIRRWSLTVSYLTKEQWATLEDVINVALVDSIDRAIDGTAHVHGGAAVSFRLAEWPDGVYASVYITSVPDDRTPFGGPQGWERSGRTVQLELEEA